LAISLQPTWAQEPKISVRETNEFYLNCEWLNHYTSCLRGMLRGHTTRSWLNY
jgi:hypothetical protein